MLCHTVNRRPEVAHFQNGFIFNISLHAEPLMTWVFNYLTEQFMLIEYESFSLGFIDSELRQTFHCVF